MTLKFQKQTIHCQQVIKKTSHDTNTSNTQEYTNKRDIPRAREKLHMKPKQGDNVPNSNGKGPVSWGSNFMSNEVHAFQLTPGVLGGSGGHALLQCSGTSGGPFGLAPFQKLFVRFKQLISASGAKFTNVFRDGRHGDGKKVRECRCPFVQTAAERWRGLRCVACRFASTIELFRGGTTQNNATSHIKTRNQHSVFFLG